ncbi:MAG: hypothetical protein HG465_002490 [Mogibacterium sp.]|uniref:ABC transporter permease n=1 Tax=Mogibacterium sp. TaxID=2049035 RepID=UPI0017FA1B11|nr:FtsX-like permease family protein [Mogibacterium sp.]MBB1532980.1 hypothetical protein [Mogibacterium sp.]
MKNTNNKSKKMTHIILIICVYFSLITPAYCFSSARSFYLQYKRDTEHAKTFNAELICNSRFLTDTEIEKLNKVQDGKVWNVKVSIDDTLPYGSGLPVSVIGMRNYNSLNENIIKGHSLYSDKSGKKLKCIVSQKLAEQLRKNTGDTINIRGTNITISGIYSSITNDQSIKMSYGTMRQIYDGGYYQHNFTGDKSSLGDVQRSLEGMDENVMIFETENKFSERNQTKNFILEMIGTKMFAGIFAVAAGVINIFILMVSEIEERKSRYALMLAVGARRRYVFIDLVNRYLFDIIAATIIMIISFKRISTILNLMDEVYFDYTAIIAVFIASVALLFMVSALGVKYIDKKPLQILLKEGGNGC